jgi:multidrug efflux pump
MWGKRPYGFVLGTMLFLLFSVGFFVLRSPNVLFFPENDPQFINVLMELPIGIDIHETDQRVREVENHIERLIEPHRQIVKSVLTTVGRGAVGEMEFSSGDSPNRGRITITFIEYENRQGVSTASIMAMISEELIGNYPGVEFMIEKNATGPPTGKAINIEVSGRDLARLIALTDSMQRMIEGSGVEGIEGLGSDLDIDNPEILIHIDREAARRFGVSTYAIANNIRTALFGREISTFKIGEEEFPIQLRLNEDSRHNLTTLMNQRITFRSQSSGRLMQVPISSVARVEYNKTYGAINRINLDRVITLSSNIVPGYNATLINSQIREVLGNFNMPEGYAFQFTGEQQEQAESMAFLIQALLIAISLIALILVTQFNSVLKPFIIIGSVIFSTAGVFFGLALFNMEFVVIMTGIGIVSLAGVVVNNAIVLIDYTDYLQKQKKNELGLSDEDYLDPEDSLECIHQAGITRFRPVILTAITTVLGLIPLAVGLNFNFATLLTRLDPEIYFGGDNAAFWGPMSWTVIFGLSVATFLTLVVVPAMYHIVISTKRNFKLWRQNQTWM